MEDLVCSPFRKRAFPKAEVFLRQTFPAETMSLSMIFPFWRHFEQSAFPLVLFPVSAWFLPKGVSFEGLHPFVSSSWPSWHSSVGHWSWTASTLQNGKVGRYSQRLPSRASGENSTPATCSLQPTSTAETWASQEHLCRPHEGMSDSPVTGGICS